VKEVVERECKWEVDEHFVLPRVDDIVPGGEVEESTVELTTAYFDTADRDLQAHGLLLRRREGDDDTGWQLKLPDANGRTEIHYPLSETLPSDLRALLTGVSLDKQLGNVATIHTTRKRYRITDPGSHQIVAEMADDNVCASVNGGTGEPIRWREIEVELGPGVDEVPRTLARRLASAGAKPSCYPSKLARVAAVSSTETRPAHRGKAEEALARYMDAQIEQIFLGDVGLRRGQGPIHDTRVAIRRLRSTLRVFGKLLDRSAIEGVEDELKWFAGTLGEVRDCQVQRRRFATALNELPPELVLGPVASTIDIELRSIEQQAREAVSVAMASPRYLDILKTLRRWSSHPPIGQPVTTKALYKRPRRAARKPDRRLAAGIAAGDDALLHRARKAAKRARYAAELVEPLHTGKWVAKAVRHFEKIQTVLGDLQDSVVARSTLLRLARKAGTTPGENGFTYGLLYANELRRADAARRAVRDLARQAGRPGRDRHSAPKSDRPID
jgi:CHAD domain-containing protein